MQSDPLKADQCLTPLRIKNAQSASPRSLITAPEGGVLNVQRCKTRQVTFYSLFATLLFSRQTIPLLCPTTPLPPFFSPKPQKAIVFDLDGTIGSFSDLYLLWTGIQNVFPTFDDFDQLLDLYPEFLRTQILSILTFVCQKRNTGECSKVFIYTNNQCSPTWANRIAHYFDHKLGEKVFDQTVNAFKIRNVRVEPTRTTKEKTFDDLIRCTLLPKNTELCFIDDTEHAQMKHDKVYYIHPQSFVHTLSIQEIVNVWVGSEICQKNNDLYLLNSESYWYQWFSMHGRVNGLSILEAVRLREKNYLVSREIMYHIKEFFKDTQNYSEEDDLSTAVEASESLSEDHGLLEKKTWGWTRRQRYSQNLSLTRKKKEHSNLIWRLRERHFVRHQNHKFLRR